MGLRVSGDEGLTIFGKMDGTADDLLRRGMHRSDGFE